MIYLPIALIAINVDFWIVMDGRPVETGVGPTDEHFGRPLPPPASAAIARSGNTSQIPSGSH